MIAQLIVAAAGIWLMFAPTAFEFTGTAAAANYRVVGPIVASVAIIAAWDVMRSIRFVNILLGFWLVVSTPVFEQPMAAAVNSVLAGAVIAFASFPRGRMTHRYDGGWRAVLRRP